MEELTKEQLVVEQKIRDRTDREREISDGKYAIKLVEKIVFGLVALITTSVIIALISLVIIRK